MDGHDSLMGAEQLPGEAHGVRFYVFIWSLLMFFTALTLGLHFAPLGYFSLPMALLIAFTKSTLVVWFFMHILEERGPGRLALGISVLFIVLLIAFLQGDVRNRFQLAVVREQAEQPLGWRPDRFTSTEHPNVAPAPRAGASRVRSNLPAPSPPTWR